MCEFYDKCMPIGLAMMLAQNNSAMQNFARMSEDEQYDVLERAKVMRSRRDMRRLVGEIAFGDTEAGRAR